MKSILRFHAAALAALLVLAAPPASTFAQQLSDSGNLNPAPLICCKCFEVHIEGITDGPDQDDGRLYPATTGQYEAIVTITYQDHSPPGVDCPDALPVKIIANLISQDNKVHREEKATIIAKTPPGQASKKIPFTLPADVARSGDSWEFTILCGTTDEDIPDTGVHDETVTVEEKRKGCSTIPIRLGGCGACSSDGCDASSGAPDTSSSSFTVTIPTFQSHGGLTEGALVFRAKELANFPGRAGILTNLPSDFTVNRQNGLITTVETGGGLIRVADTPNQQDSITITHEYPALTVLRTTVISLIDDNGTPRLRMDTNLTGDPVTRHEQSEPASGTLVLRKGRVNDTTFEPLWQETLVKTEPAAGQRVHRRTVQEKRTHADNWQTVSDIETTWENQLRGWVKTGETIDPSDAALSSVWEYYQPGDITGPGGSTEGLGRLKRHLRYDGYESFHTYSLNQSAVTTPFAGDSAGKTSTTTWDPVAKTSTTIVTAGGNVLSHTVTTHTPATRSVAVHTGQGQVLETVTTYKPSGQLFGGKPEKTLHPDGTLTTYAYSLTQDGGLQTITTTGTTTDNQTVSQGTRTTTETDSRGRTMLRETRSVGYGATDNESLESMAVTETNDILARPTKTLWLPANVTTTTAYSCCGIAMETDQYGIPTFHAYDDLKRRIKTNRLGVTTETHHLGLTTETHRYPEEVQNALNSTLAGHAGTLIGKTIRNLAGTETTIHSPDPTSDQPGVLIPASTTIVNYLPNFNPQTQDPGEISRTVTTTVPGGHSQTGEYFLDGRLYRTTGALSPAMEYAYTTNAAGAQTSQSYLDNGNLRETTTTQTDWAGRTLQTAKGTITQTYAYHGPVGGDILPGSGGQLKSVTDSDGVATLYAYNPKGERVTTATDLNANGVINYGTDQITFSETVPALRNGTPVWRTVSKTWEDADQQNPGGIETLVSTSDRTPDGLQSWSWQIGQGTTHTLTDLTTPATPQSWTVTTTRPDSTKTIQIHTDGRLASVASVNSVNQVIHSTTYGYEEEDNNGEPGIPGRLRTTTDSRTGTATTAYLSTTADIVKSITEQGSRITSFTYDPRGRRTHVDAPDTLDAQNNTLTNITETIYNPDGTVHEVKGDQTYRVEYGYDYALRRRTMKTFGTTEATTTWIYNQVTGLPDRKEYQGGDGTDYEYTSAGRLAKRTWQRGVFTEYYYDSGGRQWAIDYSDSTPDVLFVLDSLGRITHEAQGALTLTNGVPSMASPIRSINHTHDPATLLPESETHALGGLTRTLVRAHDTYGRPQVVAAGIDSDNTPATLEAIDHFTEFFYGNDGRLLGIDAKDLPRFDGKDYGIEYAYTSNSAHLIHTLTRVGSTDSLVTTHTWDSTRDALLTMDNRLDGAPNPVSQYAYTVNPLGQRDKVETVGTAFGIAPVWNWRYNPRGELVSARDTSANNRDLGYIYDGIGNRLATGNVYSVENEEEQVTNPVAYTSNALNQYTVAAGITLPSTPAPAPHDLDGNLRFDGGVNKDNEPREYVWDAENRLIEVLDVSGQSANPLVTYAYDTRSRRISRTDVAAGTTTWYLYDGWNVVAEYTGSTPALARTYTWGTDLSGTLQGAGGVGGLLVVRTGGVNYFATYDGNGNVSEYLTSAGAVAAHFEHDPFGNLTAFTEQSQGLAASFDYRFSTKPIDDITGWFYYGYRYLDPVTGRWPSRDPIGERGGVNLYEFVGNDGLNAVDAYGLIDSKDVLSLILSALATYGQISEKGPQSVKCPKTPTSERVVQEIKRVNSPRTNAPNPGGSGRPRGGGGGSGRPGGGGGTGGGGLPVLSTPWAAFLAWLASTGTAGGTAHGYYYDIRINLEGSEDCEEQNKCCKQLGLNIHFKKCKYSYEVFEKHLSWDDTGWRAEFDGPVVDSGTFELSCAQGDCPMEQPTLGPAPW